MGRTFGLAAVAGSAMLLLAWRTQEKPAVQEKPAAPAAPEASLASRVEQLEKTVAEQKSELERLARIAAGVASGAAKLAAAAEQSKAHGFEWSGPNPAARTDLLAGMNGFAEAVKLALEPPKPPEPPEHRGPPAKK